MRQRWGSRVTDRPMPAAYAYVTCANGHEVRTRLSGESTTCRQCRERPYVAVGLVLERVWLYCDPVAPRGGRPGCGHWWMTTAREGIVVKCPGRRPDGSVCGKGRRVRTGERYRQAASHDGPRLGEWDDEPDEPDDEVYDEPDRPTVGWFPTVRVPARLGVLGLLAARAAPATRAPARAPARAPRTAPSPQSVPAPRAAPVTRAPAQPGFTGGWLYRPDTPAGRCAFARHYHDPDRWQWCHYVAESIDRESGMPACAGCAEIVHKNRALYQSQPPPEAPWA